MERKEDKKSPSESGRLKRVRSWSGDEPTQKRCDTSGEKAPSGSGLKRETPEPTSWPEPTEEEKEFFEKFFGGEDEVILWESDEEDSGSHITENPVLEYIYCRPSLKSMAIEFVVDCQDLVTLAREFMGLIKKEEIVANKSRLDILASHILHHDSVLFAFVECGILDPLFDEVFYCYKYKGRAKEEPNADNLVSRLLHDPLLDFVMENQNTDMEILRGALSIVIGYWMDDAYQEKLLKHSVHLKDGLCTSLVSMRMCDDVETCMLVREELENQREKKKARQPHQEEKDDLSQSMFLSGESFLSVLDVLYKRFRVMAAELVEENPHLVVLAGRFLKTIEETNADVGLLNGLASDLMGSEKVLDALVVHANIDPLFVDVGTCLNHVVNRREEGKVIENIVCLREDPLVDEVFKNQDTNENVLRGGLSVVFGFWFDQDFYENKLTKHTLHLKGGLCASFLSYEEDGLVRDILVSQRKQTH